MKSRSLTPRFHGSFGNVLPTGVTFAGQRRSDILSNVLLVVAEVVLVMGAGFLRRRS
jgi:hypothetical protein